MNPEMVTTTTTAGDPTAPYFTLNIPVLKNEIIDCQARKIKQLEDELVEAKKVTLVLNLIICILLVAMVIIVI